MKKVYTSRIDMGKYYALAIVVLLLSCSNPKPDHWKLTSPDGKISTSIQWHGSHHVMYKVLVADGSKATEVIESSPLGIIRADQRFDSLKFISAEEIKTVAEPYTLSTGKKLQNRNHYKELTLNFENLKGSKLDIVFRAYNDGIAFKYVFPEKDDKEYTVIRELTGFNLPEGLAWMQPYDSSTAYAPAYERNYEGEMPIGTTAPFEDGWCFPALFEANEHWVLLTEANLKSNFYGSHLNPEAADGLYTVSPPEEDEAFGYGNSKAISTLPWDMPWRVIMTGDSLADIVESNLVSHVSDPSAIKDPSWVKPGRASWGWWSGYLDRTHDTPEKLKRFIDFAQTMGWEYSLVDAGWDGRKGLDLKELVAYAKERNVGLLLWYNSGGPINQVNAGPRDRMYDPEIRRQEMKRIADLGVKGVKIDFFSSDKQDFIKLYQDILADAATYKLLVNFHGCTIPRGWSRTYPNLVAHESVKGSEGYIYHADFEKNAPLHNSILPFTRNVVGPMDYTPVAFSVQQVPHRTSYGHELGLSVVFESGIQHFPDKPEVYLGLPEDVQVFLKQVPAAWEDTRFVTGYPGEEVVIARKKNEDWYVGAINGEDKTKEIEVDLSFLNEGVEYEALIIADGEKNTRFSTSRQTVFGKSNVKVEVLPIGGFVMKISKKNG